ncbi:hypothetical protein H7J06_05940 [Mycobacterium hodleri]|uniref:hypothetical protein n=1 Tax=Mycolicibacterium hodleri TaxID=49897 RepID=UPI0021F27E09|nr:hypothetical protein [Mycolicibacterium hodleri]MCV7132522.1 hypothetical protein [Mycolicibacterium hodleri]
MATGTLYRAAALDAYGDPVDSDGNVIRVGSDGTRVGVVHGIVIGGPSWRPADGGTVDTTGLIGVPTTEPNQPMHGDRLVLDGIRYTVQGPPQWATRGLVDTPTRYRWWAVTATSN